MKLLNKLVKLILQYKSGILVNHLMILRIAEIILSSK